MKIVKSVTSGGEAIEYSESSKGPFIIITVKSIPCEMVLVDINKRDNRPIYIKFGDQQLLFPLEIENGNDNQKD